MTKSTAMVRRWRTEILDAATRHGLDPYVVAGVVAQESGGQYVLPDGSCNPYAIRPEPAFFRRYFDGIMRWVKSSPQKYDDRWVSFPDLYSCSIGLLQVLYQTALEHGFVGKFPTELCEPSTGLEFGCRILEKHQRRLVQPEKVLLAYNGGGDPSYPKKVLGHVEAIRADRLFG